MSQAYLKHMVLVVFTYQHKKAWTIKNKITFRHINQLCKSYPAFYMAPKKARITLLRAGCGEGTLNRSSTKKYIYIHWCRFSTKNTLKNCPGGS